MDIYFNGPAPAKDLYKTEIIDKLYPPTSKFNKAPLNPDADINKYIVQTNTQYFTENKVKYKKYYDAGFSSIVSIDNDLYTGPVHPVEADLLLTTAKPLVPPVTPYA